MQRARRALAEFEIGGMPTVLPFHRAVVRDPAFTAEPFTVHTRWIETEFAGRIPPQDAAADGAAGPPAERERITVEVGGKRLEVTVPAGLAGGTGSGRAAPGGRAEPPGPAGAGRRRGRGTAAAAGSGGGRRR